MIRAKGLRWLAGRPLRAARISAERASRHASAALVEKALLINPMNADELESFEWIRRNKSSKLLLGVAAVAPVAAGGFALGIPGAVSFGVANAILPHMALGRLMVMAMLGAGAGVAQASLLALRSTRGLDGLSKKISARREVDAREQASRDRPSPKPDSQQ